VTDIPLKAFDLTDKVIVRSYNFVIIPTNHKYLCPACNEDMIPINGSIKIHHFRHHKTCIYQTEPDTEEHENIKLWCMVNLPVHNDIGYIDDEHTFLEIKRRADVYVVLKNGIRVVIECQASGMSIKEYETRMKDYNSIGVSVMWIFSATLGNKLKNIKGDVKNKQKRILIYDNTHNYVLIEKKRFMLFSKPVIKTINCYARLIETARLVA
jgi:competence CoiA-like predicted nuclease